MSAIASNGTGGGVVSAGASWAGGVAPAEGDTCTIVSGDTITIDANWTVGADSATPAIDVLNGGILNWDGGGAADVVTCKGDFYVRNGGTLTLDGTADVTKTLTVRLNYSAALAAGKYGMIVEDGAIVSLQGFNKTRSWDTLSATANNGQKNVITTNDNSAVWYTGDTFVVGSMTQQTASGAETDTIGAFAGTTITKAGANYTYKHDKDVAIINLTRNITITAYNTSYNGYILVYNTTLANFDCDWVAFSRLGTNSANKYGITFTAITCRASFNHCSFSNTYRTLYSAGVGTMTRDVTNCVFYVFNYVFYTSYGGAGTFTDSVALGGDGSSTIDIPSTAATVTGNHYGNGRHGIVTNITLASLANLRVYGLSGIGVDLSVYSSGMQVGNISFDNCATALKLSGSAYRTLSGSTFTFGATIANTTDINQTGFENTIKANTITLTVTNTGGRISVYDASANHKTYQTYGTFSKSNTNPRTGTYALRMLPTNASNALIASSTVPASNGVQIVVSAYFQKNAAYGSLPDPYLRLSGAGVVTDTDTMADVSGNWQLLVVSGTPTEDGFARVEFVAQSAGVGAAVDIDDVKMVYTAIDTGSMTYWFEGNLPTVLMSTGLGATDVWAAATAGMTAAGSIGLLLTTDIDTTISSRATPANITAAQAVITALLPAALVGGRMDSSVGAMANDVITAAALSAGAGDEIADALLDRINAIEAGLTPRQAMRLWSAALAGVLSGAGTNAISIRNAVANTKARIDATVDADGNRLIVVTDTV